MQFPKSLALCLALLRSTNAYSLVSTFDSSNFFNEFGFFTSGDPTDGFVDYVSQSVADSTDLVNTNNGQVYIGVDYTTYQPSGGRNSVRVTSNQAYTQGVFIADIQHMPGGICGTWPAFWMFGPNWPASGEIDIIEGVNGANTDTITLHTAPGCTVDNSNSLAGTTTNNADCNAGSGDTGCGVSTANTNAYGAGFNAVNGGVYAMQWASSGIYVWFWERANIPNDIANSEPNVESWGTPMASFSGSGCNFENSFANNNIVFDTTFCGQWAGSAWGEGSCSGMADTCQDYVANNPGAFLDAYWLINSVKVYQ